MFIINVGVSGYHVYNRKIFKKIYRIIVNYTMSIVCLCVRTRTCFCKSGYNQGNLWVCMCMRKQCRYIYAHASRYECEHMCTQKPKEDVRCLYNSLQHSLKAGSGAILAPRRQQAPVVLSPPHSTPALGFQVYIAKPNPLYVDGS